MSDIRLECWKCAAPLDDLPVPFGRADECPRCNADVHVCRMCVFYDRSVANACREPIAEPVANKERANFCGYFTARPQAGAPRRAPGAPSRAALDELFGLGAGGSNDSSCGTPPGEALDDLFGLKGKD